MEPTCLWGDAQALRAHLLDAVTDRRTGITPAAAGTHPPTPPGTRGERTPYVSPPVPRNTLNRGIKNYPSRPETTEPRRQRRLIFQHSREQVGCRIHGDGNSLSERPAVALPAGPPLQELPLNKEPKHQRQLCHLPASGWPRSKASSQQRLLTRH